MTYFITLFIVYPVKIIAGAWISLNLYIRVEIVYV